MGGHPLCAGPLESSEALIDHCAGKVLLRGEMEKQAAFGGAGLPGDRIQRRVHIPVAVEFFRRPLQ
jgi:hypothetical protein